MNTSCRRFGLVAALWMLGLAGAPPAQAQPANQSTDAEILIGKLGTPEQAFAKHVTTLSNPFFEGRAPGGNGNRVAADYIEFYFKHFGLQPVFPADAESGRGLSYRQPFEAGRDTTPVSITLRRNGDDVGLAQGTDATIMGFSASGAVEGELAFVGYSINAGADDAGDYATYQDTDRLDKKIAVMFRFEPMDDNGKSLFNGGNEGWSSAAGLVDKIDAAEKLGAAGIIVISPPGADDPRADQLETTAASARFTRPKSIPVIMMSRDAAARMLEGMTAGDLGAADLLTLRKDADSRGRVIPLTGATIQLAVEIERKARTTWNVAGVLPGRGPLASEYIVIGGHYDHVGYGYDGGSMSGELGKIHPGADDNASGTSGVLLAAEALAGKYNTSTEANARSILFMAFSAEETGLRGSRHFVENCPFSASQIHCMLNMDMIGRLRLPADGTGGVSTQESGKDPFMSTTGDITGLQVGGVGTAEGFEAILDPIFASSGLKVSKARSGRGPSDHASFYSAGVPVLFFFTGLHREYHSPADRVELISIDGGARVAGLVMQVAETLRSRQSPLPFTSTDIAVADPHSGAAGAGDPASMPGRRVRFGIMPGDYADDKAGVLVGDVTTGAPAAVAGIKKGDRLVTWNGETINDVNAWTVMLSKHKAGDEVAVGIERDGQTLTVHVKLAAAGGAAK